MSEIDPHTDIAADAMRNPYVMKMRRVLEAERDGYYKQLVQAAKESNDPAVRTAAHLFLKLEQQVVWFRGKKLVDFEKARES